MKFCGQEAARAVGGVTQAAKTKEATMNTTDATPAADRGSECTALLGRIEAHACMHDDLVMHDADQAKWAADLRMAKTEIERLTAALKATNDQAERFERGWYLRGDALEKLKAWANAYPLSVFPEPNLKRAHKLLKAGGMTLDAISASNMRHVINGVRKLVDEGLKA